MKRLTAGLILALAAMAAQAQTHQVKLTWTASAGECETGCAANTGPTLINVYRATVATGCTGSQWARIATAQPAGGPYVDASVQDGGNYCYELRAYFAANGAAVESGGSNWVHVPVPAATPPKLGIPPAPSAAAGTVTATPLQ